MRGALPLVLSLVACKGSSSAKDDGPPSEPPPPIDAAPDAFAYPPCPNPVSGETVTLRKLNPIPNNLHGITTLSLSPPGDPRLFAIVATGVIRIFKDEQVIPTAFMDLSIDAGGPVTAGGEMGLLGMAFHPKYATNGTFFLYYTTGTIANATLRDVIVRCHVSATDPDIGDPASCVEIWSVADPAVNHNGGMMEFGADGYLYVADGDGGGNQNLGRSQNLDLFFGKMLRLDVDHPAAGKEYGIPPDNPFAGGGGLPEIYMLGMRNPWRWSFDPPTGDLWLGDVGSAAIEELDVLTPAEQKGANLGWSIYEGSNCFTPPCDPAGKIFPKDERERTATGWNSIIGGQVYRGNCFPDLQGWFFYADNGVGGLAKARKNADGTLEVHDLVGTFPTRPVSIHADSRGELYMTDVSGFVYRLEAGP